LLSLHVNVLVIDVHKGPALDAVSPLTFGDLDVFEYLSLLLLCAVEVLKLLLVPFVGHLWLRDLEPSLDDECPVYRREERMSLDFVGSLLACSKTLTRVPVEQMDDQVLGFNGHADRKFENASLNIVE